MEGVLEKTSSDGTAHLGRWKVWQQNEDRYIEVSYRTSTERALLTLRSVSNDACHREAERLFNRLTRRTLPVNGPGRS
jgi:hypothetical protein